MIVVGEDQIGERGEITNDFRVAFDDRCAGLTCAFSKAAPSGL